MKSLTRLSEYIFAAKYPFTQYAKKIVSSLNIELNEEIALLGFERIKNILEKTPTPQYFLHESDAIRSLVSYASAKLLLAISKNQYLLNKFAVAESKLVYQYLNSENIENVFEIGKELGINSFLLKENQIYLNVSEFILYSPKEQHYKLIRRVLKDGKVLLTEHEAKRIVAEAVKKHILSNTIKLSEVPESFKKISEKLESLIPHFESKRISYIRAEHPPCIESILNSLKRHENLAHHARWVIALYFIHLGYSDEDILEIFSNLPDFNPKKTLYQIQHARRKKYAMPNCSSLSNYGLCVAQCNITHPLQWKRRS